MMYFKTWPFTEKSFWVLIIIHIKQGSDSRTLKDGGDCSSFGSVNVYKALINCWVCFLLTLMTDALFFLKISKHPLWRSGSIQTQRRTVCKDFIEFCFSPLVAPSHLIIPDREVHFHGAPRPITLHWPLYLCSQS